MKFVKKIGRTRNGQSIFFYLCQVIVSQSLVILIYRLEWHKWLISNENGDFIIGFSLGYLYIH